MSQQEQQLKRIQDKLRQLLKQHSALQKENKLLQEELKETKEALAIHQKNADELKQRVDVLKLAAGEMGEADKKEFEKKLNAYIREIDRCITLLGE